MSLTKWQISEFSQTKYKNKNMKRSVFIWYSLSCFFSHNMNKSSSSLTDWKVWNSINNKMNITHNCSTGWSRKIYLILYFFFHLFLLVVCVCVYSMERECCVCSFYIRVICESSGRMPLRLLTTCCYFNELQELEFFFYWLRRRQFSSWLSTLNCIYIHTYIHRQ